MKRIVTIALLLLATAAFAQDQTRELPPPKPLAPVTAGGEVDNYGLRVTVVNNTREAVVTAVALCVQRLDATYNAFGPVERVSDHVGKLKPGKRRFLWLFHLTSRQAAMEFGEQEGYVKATAAVVSFENGTDWINHDPDAKCQ